MGMTHMQAERGVLLLWRVPECGVDIISQGAPSCMPSIVFSCLVINADTVHHQLTRERINPSHSSSTHTAQYK